MASFVFAASVGTAVAMTRCEPGVPGGAAAVSAVVSPFAVGDLPPAPPDPGLPPVKPDGAPVPPGPDGGVPDGGLVLDAELIPDPNEDLPDAAVPDVIPLTARSPKAKRQ